MPFDLRAIAGKAWRKCRDNLRANLLAGLVIWTIGASVCISYHYLPGCRGLLDEIALWKKQSGYFFAACSTALFGGLIPYLNLLARGEIPKDKALGWGLFFLCFWGYKGMEVDAFYRLQSMLFGNSTEITVLASKVFVDQFVYCVIWSAPMTAICFGWKDSGFSWKFPKEYPRMIFEESIFLLFSTWIIWIPAVSFVYSMPENLQMPMFNLTLCFFVLVITVLGKR